ncbi:MAG: cytochrome c [Thermoanaerobaculia bacterium]
MKRTATLCLVALLAAIAAVPATALAAEDGAAIFKARCAACHGPDGSGDTMFGKKNQLADLGSPEVQSLSDAELTKIISEGKDGKASHAFAKKGVSGEQIKALVSFIRTLEK